MKDIYILGIESSCDETSASVVMNGKEVLSNVVVSQIKTHKVYGGVVPEIASRQHTEVITMVIEEAMNKAELNFKDLSAIAVTNSPGLVGSLLVGINAAKALSFAHKIPLIGINHLTGHIYANQIENELKFPLVCLVVSGGHTELIYMKGHYNFELIGETQDDAAGEAYDKVARVLNLSYPGGPVIDKLAQQGNDIYNLPRVMINDGTYNFSFSGLKSAVINLNHNAKQKKVVLNKSDLATSFQNAVVDVLVSKTKKLALEKGVKQVLLSGGVAANSSLRKQMNDELSKLDIEVIYPALKYCTDNAAMIAVSGYYAFINGKQSDLNLEASSHAPLW